ncbi:MAG: hypothetical protein LKI94_13280 [Sporolactobacillus sp.]|jgi:ABC-type proline/glycine betaine transport system permease subunit|nr:hypothetical protein [Sporolactobacillus sp.]MCI1883152.1 hypothetical protein [Sporolactobacillus sp.]
MIGYYVQLLVCYVSVGAIMGIMLGIAPLRRSHEPGFITLFLVLLVTWLPIALLSFAAAPFAVTAAASVEQTNE